MTHPVGRKEGNGDFLSTKSTPIFIRSVLILGPNFFKTKYPM